MTKLDHTLASNYFTAYVPRPDQVLVHGAKYLGQNLLSGVRSALEFLSLMKPRPNPSQPSYRAPGNAASMTDATAVAPGASPLPQLKCAETGRLLETLPLGKIAETAAYFATTELAYNPVSLDRVGTDNNLVDAFLSKNVLPESVLTSSLLNAGTEEGGSVTKLGAKANTLFDPKTGFNASITIRDGKEVVISFGCLGSQGGTIQQAFRAGFNLLGLSPSKNMAQASKLTAMVKDHLATIKSTDGTPKYKLVLSGHSMGGGMATYAALRNDVPAVVIAPMRLGLLTRAKIGLEMIKKAPSLVQEVVVQGDWLADNRLSRAYGWMNNSTGALGTRQLIPAPTSDEISKKYGEYNFNRHVDIPFALVFHRENLESQARRLENIEPSVIRTDDFESAHESTVESMLGASDFLGAPDDSEPALPGGPHVPAANANS